MAKGPEAFRTISEAAEELGVPQHVLRFWETKFSFIRPMKRAGGRRFYRPQDLMVLKGVQRLHKEQGVRRLLAAGQGLSEAGSAGPAAAAADELMGGPPETALEAAPTEAGSQQLLREALDALEAAKARLTRALSAG